MRVFVAGASGVIGRPLVRDLVDGGHEVTGMTRSEDRAESIRAAGAAVAICDALDAAALRDAVAAARPEVVVHQLTALPKRLDPRKRGIYEPVGGWVKDEEAPTLRPGESGFARAVAAVLDLERQVLESRLEGLVLRYGFFYGPGSSYAPDGFQAEQVRRRRFPIIDGGTGTFSFIHVDDAAAATVAASVRGLSGIYNVVDDDPAPLREWLPAYAETLGAKPPFRVPLWLARLLGGRAVATLAVELRGASSAKAKRELGWAPRYASWRQGFREAL